MCVSFILPFFVCGVLYELGGWVRRVQNAESAIAPLDNCTNRRVGLSIAVAASVTPWYQRDLSFVFAFFFFF